MARARGNEHKPEHRRFPGNARNHICAVRMKENWQRLPRGCGVPLEIFRSLMDEGSV